MIKEHLVLSNPTAERPGVRFGIPVTDLTMILVVLIWGANFSVVKLALAQIPPVAFAALRFAVAGVILYGLMRWREGAIQYPPGVLRKLIVMGIVGNTLYQICFTVGLSMTTAANSALMIATTPALVAFFGAALGIEKLTRNILIGIGMAISGVLLVLSARGLNFTPERLIGDLLPLAAAVCWTYYTLGVRTLSGGLSPLRITAMTMITGVPGLLLLATPELMSVRWAMIDVNAWAGLAYASLLGLVVAYVLWNNSVRVVGSNRTAIYGCAIPLVATLVAWPVLGELPTPLQGLGAIFIVAGVLISRRA
jgi:drug/metabolite transporter (DMT)-like permease